MFVSDDMGSKKSNPKRVDADELQSCTSTIDWNRRNHSPNVHVATGLQTCFDAREDVLPQGKRTNVEIVPRGTRRSLPQGNLPQGKRTNVEIVPRATRRNLPRGNPYTQRDDRNHRQNKPKQNSETKVK